MKQVIRELIANIKDGFVLCDRKEAESLHGKRVLVIASAGGGALEQLVENFLLPANAHISISGTARCRQYIEDVALEDAEYFFHEGKYGVDSLDYKILKYKKFDALIYLVTQKDLYSYINIEYMCQDYNKNNPCTVYCADIFGDLWKNTTIDKYIACKEAYKNLIDYSIMRGNEKD